MDEFDAREFEYIVPRSVSDSWSHWLVGYDGVQPEDMVPERDVSVDLDDPDVYPPTVYAHVVEDVEFEPDASYYEGFDDFDSGEFTRDTYTAVGYWMVYVHDPKPRGIGSLTELATHTGDQEAVYVLFDEDTGEPEWVLASQHFGGEYRRWEHVESVDGRPVVYPAEGAHSNFLGVSQSHDDVDDVARSSADADGDPEYIYQKQYVEDPGSPERHTSASVVGGYQDRIAGDGGYTWAHDDADVADVDGSYEVALLTGREAWSDYEGSVYTYPQPVEEPFPPSPRDTGAVDGGLPTRESLFDAPGDWAMESGEGEDRLYPAAAQVDGRLSGDDVVFRDLPDRLSPEQRVQESVNVDGDLNDTYCVSDDVTCVEAPPPVVSLDTVEVDSDALEAEGLDDGWNQESREHVDVEAETLSGDVDPPDLTVESDGELGFNVVNTGLQPHDFTLAISGDDEPSTHSVYVNSMYPRNLAGTEVGVESIGLDEGRHGLQTALSLYPGDFELDSDEVDLDVVDIGRTLNLEPYVEVLDEEVDAGVTDEPRDVAVDVRVHGLPWTVVEQADWNASVDGERVDVEPRGSGSPSTSDDRHDVELGFESPAVEEPGSYDFDLVLEHGDFEVSDSVDGLVVYGAEDGLSGGTATVLVVDDSGSMSGSPVAAARSAAGGVVDAEPDSSYVGVVSFDHTASTRQPVTRLSDGRSEVEDAISSISAGGGTNIAAGFRRGLSLLEDAPDSSDLNLVLLTDGGDSRARGNILPGGTEDPGGAMERANSMDVCVQTSALGSGADAALMSDIAEANDCGGFTETDEAGRLVEDFQGIQREIDASSLLALFRRYVEPMSTSSAGFSVDDDVEQVVVNVLTSTPYLEGDAGAPTTSPSDAPFLSTSAEPEVRLTRPNGSSATDDDPDVEVSSFGDRVVYRVDDPATGDWDVEVDGGDVGTEVDARVTADSPVDLVASTPYDEYYAGGEAVVRAVFEGREPVSGADVSMEVEAPDGSTNEVGLTELDDGVYRGSVPLSEDVTGRYNATVSASHEETGVERMDTLSWRTAFAAPVDLAQDEVASGTPGSTAETTLEVEPAALFGVRSAEVGLGDFEAADGDDVVYGGNADFTSSHMLSADESLEVDFSVDLPGDVELGRYEAPAYVFVDGDTPVVGSLDIDVVESGDEPGEVDAQAMASGGDVEPVLEFEGFEPDGEVTAGSNVSFSGSVSLDSGFETVEDVALRVNGSVVDSREVDVVAGEEKRLAFVHSFDEAGSYEVEVGEEAFEVDVSGGDDGYAEVEGDVGEEDGGDVGEEGNAGEGDAGEGDSGREEANDTGSGAVNDTESESEPSNAGDARSMPGFGLVSALVSLGVLRVYSRRS
ncbi:MAG: VWA domain-containing protein [Halobacteriales archaeon]